MSFFVRNSVCPKCRARGADRQGNNLAEYSDGHKWCWSCHYYEHGDKSLRSLFKDKESMPVRVDSSVELPADTRLLTEAGLSSEPLLWLVSYGITVDEMNRLKFMWSEERKWLMFPVLTHKGEVLAFQARIFGKGPKYYNSPNLHKHLVMEGWSFYADDTYNICVVEDMISAIKVGRVMPSMCLFGSALLSNHIAMLEEACDKAIFWLDLDKAETSERYARLLGSRKIRTAVVVTRLDPKSYTTEEISDILETHRDT
jgi:hypothetical protein